MDAPVVLSVVVTCKLPPATDVIAIEKLPVLTVPGFNVPSVPTIELVTDEATRERMACCSCELNWSNVDWLEVVPKLESDGSVYLFWALASLRRFTPFAGLPPKFGLTGSYTKEVAWAATVTSSAAHASATLRKIAVLFN